MNSRNSKDQPGKWKWVICGAAFVVQFIVAGQINCGGVIYSALVDQYNKSRGETALVSSLAASSMSLFAPLSTSLCEYKGCWVTVLLGAMVCILGLVTSSFATSLATLYFTYGILWALGTSLCYFPTFVILPKYFWASYALASGIVGAGSSCGTLALSPVIEQLVLYLGIANTFRILAGLHGVLIVCGLVFRHRPSTQLRESGKKRKILYDCTIFKNKGFVVWMIAVTLFMLGYLVPYVHLVKMAEDNGAGKTNAALLVSYLAAGSMVGRLVIGKVSDMMSQHRIYICQSCLLCISVASTLVPLASSYNWFVVYSCIFGFFSGGFIVLNPVITTDVVGRLKLPYALGLCYFTMSFTRAAGPPTAGWIYDSSRSYFLAFLCTGVVTLGATLVMFIVPLLISTQNHTDQRTEVTVVKSLNCNDDCSSMKKLNIFTDDTSLLKNPDGFWKETVL